MNRYKSLQQFLNPHFEDEVYQLAAITGDASFRRYFRLNRGQDSYIVMDSDPALSMVSNYQKYYMLMKSKGSSY
jgi:aminoglycoside/choline kinase family phosphotransferase